METPSTPAATLSLPTVWDQYDGKPNADYVECAGCENGVVERVADDYDGDTGAVGYQYLNGCASVRVRTEATKSGWIRIAMCATCVAAEAVPIDGLAPYKKPYEIWLEKTAPAVAS